MLAASLVKDILPGITGSGPTGLVDVDGTLYFVANDGVHGTELWKSDGTETGTVLVKDIRPGVAGASPANLTRLGDALLFTVDDGVHGMELWRSDGTEAGTRIVLDIQAGSAGSSPGNLTDVDGVLFFTATMPVSGNELWKSDGTEAGTSLVKDIWPGTLGSRASNLVNVGGLAYFAADDGSKGLELWRSDGTVAGTVLVKDAYPGRIDSGPRNLTDVNGTLFFTTFGSGSGFELWKSDGTAAGTSLVKDIAPGSASSSPGNLVNVGGTLFFTANDGFTGTEVWKSDGTAAGTALVKDVLPGSAGAFLGKANLTAANGLLFFTTFDTRLGYKLWRSDGTEAGTAIVRDISPDNSSAFAAGPGGVLVFAADDGVGGMELWQTDGTGGGTIRLDDIRPGRSGSAPQKMTWLDGDALFTADNGAIGRELWKAAPASPASGTSRFQFAAFDHSVSENGGGITLSVTRTGDLTASATVGYATAYNRISGTLSFAPGQASGTITVPIQDNQDLDGTRYILVDLSNPTGGAIVVAPGTARVRITDWEEGEFRFSAGEYTAAEDAGRATVTVQRVGGSDGPASVRYATGWGTATAGLDYLPVAGTLSFAPGQTSATVVIPILDDTIVEPDETVYLTLDDATNGALLRSPLTAHLTLRDVEAGQMQFLASGSAVPERGGRVTITVIRTGGADGAVSVGYATGDGTASAGSDYAAVAGTLHFAAGEMEKSFIVPILDDGLVGVNETFSVTLDVPTGGARLGPASSLVVTIGDDEPALPVAAAFDDPDLAAAVRGALGLSAGQPILTGDLARLGSLSADSNLIDSLQGLEWATHLESLTLIPTSYARPGLLGSLTPLAGLTHLTSLTLVGAGLDDDELRALSQMGWLQTLDLRYNGLHSLAPLAGLTGLHSLQVYGNPLDDLSVLRGLPVAVDLPPPGTVAARTIPDLARDLQYLPLRILEYVTNQVAFEAYPGLMKGPQATLETLEGNDWDQAALLVDLLRESGVTARFASGRAQFTADAIRAWLGVTTTQAALDVLQSAKLDPVLAGAGTDQETVSFDHAWVEAWLVRPDAGPGWVPLDPSWKFKEYQEGIPNILGLVPFDEVGYFSQSDIDLASDYYEDQVARYLAANLDEVSLADVPRDGPIRAQVIVRLPERLPYDVAGTTTYAHVPLQMTHRVRIKATWLDYTLVVPDVSLERVTIHKIPGLPKIAISVDGHRVAEDSLNGGGSSYILTIEQFDPGDDVADRTSQYNRPGDQYLALVLDAGQISDAMLARQQEDINRAAIAVREGEPYRIDDQVGALLALGVLKNAHDWNEAIRSITRLTHAVPVRQFVGTGLASSVTDVVYDWELQNPAVPLYPAMDLKRFDHHLWVPADGNRTTDSMRSSILWDTGSALEHALWEEVANAEGISSIKAIRLAHERGIPVYWITDPEDPRLGSTPIDPIFGNLPAIREALRDGATLIIPSRRTPLNDWDGYGYILRFPQPDPRGGYFISGGHAISGMLEGGAATSPPGSPPDVPEGSNPNNHEEGDPVNIANGNVTRDEVDVALPGIGMGLRFERHYDSQSTADFGLGPGWTHSYGDSLTPNADGSVLWTNTVGYRYLFRPDGRGGFLTPSPLFGVLTRTSSGFDYREKDGTIHRFDAAGRLLQVRDRNGNGLDLTYDAAGQLAYVRDAGAPGRFLAFTYADGRIATVSDFTGRTWAYAYADGRLSRVTHPSDAATPARTMSYTYYTDPALAGLLRRITRPDGGTWGYTYYPNRRAFQVTDPEGFTETFSFNLYRRETTVTDERGNPTVFAYNLDGNVTRIVHADLTVEQLDWRDQLLQGHTDAFGQVEGYRYDAQGNMTQFTDRAGQVTQYTYDPTFGTITRIDEPGGRATRFEYDARGNLLAEIGVLGQITRYTVDARGLVLTQTLPKGTQTAKAGDYTTSYAYDAAGLVIEVSTDLPSRRAFVYDERGNLIRSTDELGHATTSTYNAMGEALTITDAAGQTTRIAYDQNGNVVAVTDRLGRVTRYEYDLRQLLTRTTAPDGTYRTGIFDAARNPIAAADELGHWTQSVHDGLDRPTYTVLADGTTTLALDDGGGRLKLARDGNGNATRFAYDPVGRLTAVTYADGRTTSTDYDEVGNPIRQTDLRGQTWSYTFDLLNRVTQVRGPAGYLTTTDYDANGNMIRLTQYETTGLADIPADPRTLSIPHKRTTTNVYDVADRLVTQYASTGEITRFGLDAAGNLTWVSDSLGHMTRYGYDALNRLITSSDPLGHVTRYGYDIEGNPTSVTNPLGQISRSTYDVRDRQTADIDAVGQATSWVYDAAGNVLAITDPAGNRTTYGYDSRDRVIRETDALGASRLFAYDANGNTISENDRNCRVRRFAYDVYDLMTSEQWYEAGSDEPVRTLTYTWNAAGDLLSAQDPDSAYSYRYDAMGRVTEVDNAGTPGVSEVRLVSGYDTLGDRISMVTWIDEKAREETSYEYNKLGRLSRITQKGAGVPALRVDLGYNVLGQITTVSRYGNPERKTVVARTTYAYDGDSRLATIRHANSAGTTLASYAYTYDAASRIAKVEDIDGTTVHAYDATGQLTGSDSSYQADEGYGYDASGNRTNAGYQTGPGNRLLSDGTYAYEYDGEGNRIRRTSLATGEVTTYAWDHRNRLSRVVVRDAQGNVTKDVSYTYDVFDRRIGKAVDPDGAGPASAAVDRFVYDGDQIAFQFDGARQIMHRYLYGPAVDQVLADVDADGRVLWTLTDHQGTVRDLVDATGAVRNHIRYGSFGQVVGETDPSVDYLFGYTGREYDAETGLNYYRARYYDAAAGRFLSEDPSGFAAGDANLYRYVGNSPANFTDPSGRYLVPIALVAIDIAIDFAISLAVGEVIDQLLDALNPGSDGESSSGSGSGRKKDGPTKQNHDMIENILSVIDLAASVASAAGILRGGTKLLARRIFTHKGGKGLGNPFRGKSAAEIDAMFRTKGFSSRGPDPVKGLGGYVDPKTGRSYHIDPRNRFGEPPHVDVNRPKDYNGPLDKKKYEY